MPEALRARAALPLLLVLVACSATPSPTTTPTAMPTPTASPTAAATTGSSAPPPPTATPLPLALVLPSTRDPREVQVSVKPDVPSDGDGTITVEVTNLSSERVVELVLRWDTALRDTLFLAPFKPAESRIVQGGPPLYQEWTKWVDGPGEQGEPAGTTSLGWGPLDPGATLTIPIVVTRKAPGPVSFDLQVLAGEAILTLPDGTPADLRVEVPS